MHKRVLMAAALLTVMGGFSAQAQWTERNLGAGPESLGVRDFDMPSANVIWGVNYDGTAANAPVQDIFVSTDGGQNWLTNTISLPSAAALDLANVSAIDGQTAFFAAFDGTNGGGFLYKTADGGNTFTELTLPTVAWLNVVHFFSATEGIIQSDPDAATPTNMAVYRTTDGGATWTRVTGMPTVAADDFGLTNQYYAVGNHIWFTTFKGQVFHSPDRGQTWTKAASGYANQGTTTQALKGIAFSDSLNGIVVGRTNQIRRTTDGGATWAAVTRSGPFYTSGLTAVPGVANAYVSTGADPAVALGSSLTLNGGATWTAIDTATQYTEVTFFDNQHGWAGNFTQPSGVGGVFEYTGAAITPLAAPHAIERTAMAAYPNPTTGLLRLNADKAEVVTVYDLKGRVLRRHNVATEGTSLNIGDLGAGLYQLVFTGGKTARTQRVVVQ